MNSRRCTVTMRFKEHGERAALLKNLRSYSYCISLVSEVAKRSRSAQNQNASIIIKDLQKTDCRLELQERLISQGLQKI